MPMTEPQAAPNPQTRSWGSYIRRLIIALLVSIILVIFALVYAFGYMTMYTLARPNCITYPDPMVQSGLAFEEVTFNSGNLTLQAYFIPADTDATVILTPTVSADHGAQYTEAELFHDLGLNVLAMGARVCYGARNGTIGFLEGNDVNAAYNYLTTRTDLNPQRVSAHGFSAGGAAALYGASRTPQIAAVSAMGNYHDFSEVIGTFNWLDPGGNVYRWGNIQGFRVGSGLMLPELKPIEIVEQIAPRPILFVYGTEEVSRFGGQKMYDRVSDTSEFLSVPGAGHGNYFQVQPDLMRQRLGGFHYQALLGEPLPDTE